MSGTRKPDQLTAIPTFWEPGCADEEWKIRIDERDIRIARETAGWLRYILEPDAGTVSPHSIIRKYTGEQIADALVAYEAKCRKAIENGKAAQAMQGAMNG